MEIHSIYIMHHRSAYISFRHQGNLSKHFIGICFGLITKQVQIIVRYETQEPSKKFYSTQKLTTNYGVPSTEH